MNCVSWTVNHELWTMNCEPWTVNHELWTVNHVALSFFVVLNDLREYQVLKGWQLPADLRAVIATESHNSAKSCAQRCGSGSLAHKCRSFLHDARANHCTFYSKSLLINEADPIKADQYDLYQYSECLFSLLRISVAFCSHKCMFDLSQFRRAEEKSSFCLVEQGQIL